MIMVGISCLDSLNGSQKCRVDSTSNNAATGVLARCVVVTPERLTHTAILVGFDFSISLGNALKLWISYIELYPL